MCKSMSLREKLRQLNQLTEDANPEEAISSWRETVASLYAKVRQFLAEYERDGLVQFETRVVSRSEDVLGTYDIDMLLVHMGLRAVVFSPVARYDLGGDGRADMYVQGHVGQALRLRWLASPAPDGTWAIELKSPRSNARTKQTRPLAKLTIEEGLDLLLG
jgi:hypothetical protein